MWKFTKDWTGKVFEYLTDNCPVGKFIRMYLGYVNYKCKTYYNCNNNDQKIE